MEVVGGQLHAPASLPPRERAPGTHWTGSWVGPRAVLDAVVKRKIPSAGRESNPRTPIVQPVAQRYTDWAITALLNFTVCSKIKFKELTVNGQFGRKSSCLFGGGGSFMGSLVWVVPPFTNGITTLYPGTRPLVVSSISFALLVTQLNCLLFIIRETPLDIVCNRITWTENDKYLNRHFLFQFSFFLSISSSLLFYCR
jgi:hypothetical protein